MAWKSACRRRYPRFPLEEATGSRIEFEFPRPGCGWLCMRLRDLSQSGLSFVLSHELPGLSVGDSLDGVQIRVDGRQIRGDLLVMHLSPDASAGSVCGALFYPIEDEDVLTLREVIRALERTMAPVSQGVI